MPATVVLDSRDLPIIDQEFAQESVVWELLQEGGRDITEQDFVGAREVRVNKMTGFTKSQYNRNGDNKRSNVSVEKQTIKLEVEDWMGYDLDALDQMENPAFAVANVVEGHVRQIAIPAKDQRAIDQLYQAAIDGGEVVTETITSENVLNAYDLAEEHMIDNQVSGLKVMFVSTETYRALKQTTNVTKHSFSFNGINRTVDTIDNDTAIIPVPKDRLQVVEGTHINFIKVSVRVAAPIERKSDITHIPASDDRDGYRDTIKGLNYYDLIVFDNAKVAIYASVRPAA